MKRLFYVKCRKCGHRVRIPWYWVVGVEGIFYCRRCRQHYKIDYRLGAVLTGLGWALALAVVNILAWFTAAVTLVVAAVTFIPMGIFFSFLMRRRLLGWSSSKKSR